MTIDRETLMAFADGELNEIETKRVARAVEADPALAAEVAAHRALKTRLAGHFAPIIDAPVPERLTALLTDKVVNFATAREQRGWRWMPSWGMSGAVAAALVLGLGIGTRIPGGGPVVGRNGVLVASGNLERALDTQLASTQGNAPIRMLISFRDGGGAICRGFDGEGLSGIACRKDGRWAVRQALASGGDRTIEYRQAASSGILAAAQDMAQDEPLDVAGEKAARDRGWR